jgi:hypothetical protein
MPRRVSSLRGAAGALVAALIATSALQTVARSSRLTTAEDDAVASGHHFAGTVTTSLSNVRHPFNGDLASTPASASRNDHVTATIDF